MNKLTTKFASLGICVSAFAFIMGCEKIATTAAEETQAPAGVLKTQGGPVGGSGWTLENPTYSIHKPWNLPLSDRYTYNPTYEEHTFWIYPNDEPFQQGSSTSPRCELRFNNDYTVGDRQFEADIKVYSASDSPVLMQIFGTSANSGAPAFNLKAHNDDGGSLKRFDDISYPALATNVYDKWVHVNIVHKAKLNAVGTIDIYIDGVKVNKQFYDKGYSSHYFKCGVYTTQTSPSKVKIKHIRIYKR